MEVSYLGVVNLWCGGRISTAFVAAWRMRHSTPAAALLSETCFGHDAHRS